jgi:hypothetical protein
MICQLGEEGVSKDGVAWHYRKWYKAQVPLQVRKELVQYANNFERCEPSEVQYPTTIISQIEGLAVQIGVLCSYDKCNYACRRWKSIVAVLMVGSR